MAYPQKKILVPIAEGTASTEAVGLIHALRCAGAAVTVASIEKEKQVETTQSVKLVADALISDCVGCTFDLIALPGGAVGGPKLRDCVELESLVKKHVANGGLYGAICAGSSVVLSSWGLLNGLKASNKFAVSLIEQLYGKQKAEEVAESLVLRTQHGVELTMKELNPIDWKFNGIPQILVLLANGTDDTEASFIIYVLRMAGASVIVASVESTTEIMASREVKFIADVLLDEVLNLDFDLVLLPGGLRGAQTFANSEKLISLLKKQAKSNKLYGAICASPAIVLEPHGLLKGKKATCYPRMFEKLSDKSESNNRVVVDGNVITSQGPGTVMEFALSIVEKLYGRNKALELARFMVF